MNVQAAKAVARQWVMSAATAMPGFAGAFTAGSIDWLPADAALPATSDVDRWVVFAAAAPPEKLGNWRIRALCSKSPI